MDGLVLLHSIIRWLLLIVAVICIIRAYKGIRNNSIFLPQDKLLYKLLLSFCHSQLLLGLILYIFGAWGIKNIQQMGMAAIMKNSLFRFFAMEHILIMLVAILIIQMGSIKLKKVNTDYLKYKTILVYISIGLGLILISIPWPFRELFLNRGWL